MQLLVTSFFFTRYLIVLQPQVCGPKKDLAFLSLTKALPIFLALRPWSLIWLAHVRQYASTQNLTSLVTLLIPYNYGKMCALLVGVYVATDILKDSKHSLLKHPTSKCIYHRFLRRLRGNLCAYQ